MTLQVTNAKVKAKAIAKLLRDEHPDYNYLKNIFRHLRTELDIQVTHSEMKLPKVPTEEELQKYYQAVRKTRNVQDMVIIKTFLYTGVRVSELVNIQLKDVILTVVKFGLILVIVT
jgi:integrase/recombinase XerD